MNSEDLDLARRLASDTVSEVLSVSFIDAGYSSDRKFHVVATGGEFVMRLALTSDLAARRFEFDAVRQLRSLGVRCPEAIRFGCPGETCYGLYSYLPGACATDALPTLSSEQQLTIGLRAGEQLKLIHGSLASPDKVDDYEIRGGKFRKHREMLAESGITFRGQHLANEFVEANLHLLRDRPTTFRHGDFHPGNLIVDGTELSGVIDFNRADWGDPFDDFYKTAYFGAPVSAMYAIGLVRGYFGGDPPAEFWPIYNVYVGAVLPADIVWCQALYPDQVADAIKRVEWITGSHDFVGGGLPAWWL
jgi:aminoglycoside phosphotransferase (APT) family kinase protein